MLQPFAPAPEPLIRMPDGTVKQLNPFSGTEVWTVPGRGHRPIGVTHVHPERLHEQDHGQFCAFCEGRYLETPPEKSRLVRDGGRWVRRDGLPAGELSETAAEFRRIPNLFEIVTYPYWVANYGYRPPARLTDRHTAYTADPAGREHLLSIMRTKLSASGIPAAELDAMPEDELVGQAVAFFAGGHDVIVARRHYRDGAVDTSELASSGDLSVEEHARYVGFTVEALRDLYDANRYARYVAVFQNWLKPAGASFDHLHKQLAAIDERGVQAETELFRLRANPNLYNELGVNYAAQHNLVIAENEHAIVYAGVGHRYPTLEVWSKSGVSEPWLQAGEELRAMSDLVHACHAAAGPDVPCNEEWHHRPPDVDVPMPWRINIKWRVSTVAGFEGGTKIYLNTIDPWTLRDRVVAALFALREQGRIGEMSIATECPARPNSLRYNRP